jgi:Holliday junction DNA helicase RuvA
VQGVGARVALSLLGVLRPQELATAIALGDKAALTRAAGVGSRLAARIAAELKDRVGGLPVATNAAATVAAILPAGPVEDALSALVNLGYGRSDAFAALARAQGRLGDGAKVDQLIREGLKELAG